MRGISRILTLFVPWFVNSSTLSRRRIKIFCKIQTIAFEVSFLQSQISIDVLVLEVSFATFR